MKIKNPAIFVVEDDPAMNKLLTTYLKSKGYSNVFSYLSGEEAIENIDKKPDVVMQDFDLGEMNGLDVLKRFKKESPLSEFIFLSGQNSIKVAVDAMRFGAFDYIMKDDFAKENALNKINKLKYINKLQKEKKELKIASIVFLIFIILTWLGILYWQMGLSQ